MTPRSIIRTAQDRVLVRGVLTVMLCLVASEGRAPEPEFETFELVDMRPPAPQEPKATPRSAQLAAARVRIAEVRLGPIDEQQLRDEDATSSDKLLRIGVGRQLAVSAGDGAWRTLADGRLIWILDLVSEQARGIRLHFAEMELPESAEVVAFAPADASELVGPFRGRGPDGSGEFWAPTIFAEHVRIELTLPPGARQPAKLPFVLAEIQHLYRDPLDPEEQAKAAGTCHNDVACHPAWATSARAIGRYSFIKRGSSRLCSGQLINHERNDFTPLFLTANHCVSTATEAASVEVYWLYQSSNCNVAPPRLGAVPRSSSARLLVTGAENDFSLLHILGPLPAGLTWLAWSSRAVPDGTSVVCIHHPAGDYKRISFGRKSAVSGSCQSPRAVRVQWISGPTEGGSSGSAVLLADTRQIVGQLSCGPSSCGSVTYDDFGSFAAAFPSMKPFLTADGGTGRRIDPECQCGIGCLIPMFATAAGLLSGGVRRRASRARRRVG